MRIWIKEFNYEYDFFESEICTKEGSKKLEKDFDDAIEFVSIDEINRLEQENARLLKNYESVKSLLKDLCDEWNEDCEESCDSYGHDELCRSVNIIQAKISLNEQIKEVVQDNNKLEQENARLREALEFEHRVSAFFDNDQRILSQHHRIGRVLKGEE